LNGKANVHTIFFFKLYYFYSFTLDTYYLGWRKTLKWLYETWDHLFDIKSFIQMI